MTAEFMFLHELSRCRPLLNSIVKRADGRKLIEEEDLRQEILYNAWRSYPGFRGESKFSTWFYRIGLLTLYQSFRQIKTWQPTYLSEDSHEHEDYSSFMSINYEFELSQILPHDELKLFILYMDGYSYDEISRQLGITISNTGVKLHRIRKKLNRFFTVS